MLFRAGERRSFNTVLLLFTRALFRARIRTFTEVQNARMLLPPLEVEEAVVPSGCGPLVRPTPGSPSSLYLPGVSFSFGESGGGLAVAAPGGSGVAT